MDDNGKSQLFTARLEMIELILQPWKAVSMYCNHGMESNINGFLRQDKAAKANQDNKTRQPRHREMDYAAVPTKAETKIKIKSKIVTRQRQR